MDKKNISIQYLRIFAMILIILCHIVQHVNNPNIEFLSQFFNVGVYIFLFISGHLYGKKDKINIKKFFTSRFMKIIIPIYIFGLFSTLIYVLKGEFEFGFLISLFLNVEYYFTTFVSCSHLWFITIITLCYILTPLLIKYKKKISNKYIMLLYLFFSIIVSYFSTKFGSTLFFIFCYVIGFIYKTNNNNIKNYIYLLIAIGIRILSKFLLDETVLYNIIITSLTQIMISISLFNIFTTIKFKKFSLINFLDEMSFYIYITHYQFMVGPFKTMDLTNNILINLIITLILSFLSGYCLKLIVDCTINIIKKDNFV